MKKAILLINLGSPASLSPKHVWKFLTEFLNDARVIDLPFIVRKILVNMIIVPFRTLKSRNMYKQIWKGENSPIIQYSNDLIDKIRQKIGKKYDVHIAMRYCQPNIKEVLQEMYLQQYDEIKIVPLFPHYASSTTGSIIERVMKIISKWNNIPNIKFQSSFYDNPLFVNAWVDNINNYKLDDYEHILFSYHGLPISHVNNNHAENEDCKTQNCTKEINEFNRFCYQAQCYETTRLFVEKLKLPKHKYSLCFQSRFSKKWLEPFADGTIINLANQGVKKILVLPISFVADCLETDYEIGQEYDELFQKHGGKKLTAVKSLNANNAWIDALAKIIIDF